MGKRFKNNKMLTFTKTGHFCILKLAQDKRKLETQMTKFESFFAMKYALEFGMNTKSGIIKLKY